MNKVVFDENIRIKYSNSYFPGMSSVKLISPNLTSQLYQTASEISEIGLSFGYKAKSTLVHINWAPRLGAKDFNFIKTSPSTYILAVIEVSMCHFEHYNSATQYTFFGVRQAVSELFPKFQSFLLLRHKCTSLKYALTIHLNTQAYGDIGKYESNCLSLNTFPSRPHTLNSFYSSD